MISSFVPLPDPHDDLGPGFLSAPGTYHLKIMRVGNPPTEHLTLFCRFALPADVDTTTSSIPTPGDARGSLTVGAFDATTLQPEELLVRGPDGRRPAEARPRGADERARSRAERAAGPRAPPRTPAAPRRSCSRRRRRPTCRATLRSWALDAGDPGFDYRFGAGRLRLDLNPPTLGSPTVPAAGSIVSGVLNLRAAARRAGHARRGQASLDGVPLPSVVGADKVVSGSVDTRLLADGTHVLRVDARDRVGNAGSYTVSFTIDNTRPALRIRARARRPREQPAARDHGRVRSRLGRRRGTGRGVRRPLDGEGLAHPASVRSSGPLHAARLGRGSRGQHGGRAADRARRRRARGALAGPEPGDLGRGARDRATSACSSPVRSCARCTSAAPRAGSCSAR